MSESSPTDRSADIADPPAATARSASATTLTITAPGYTSAGQTVTTSPGHHNRRDYQRPPTRRSTVAGAPGPQPGRKSGDPAVGVEPVRSWFRDKLIEDLVLVLTLSGTTPAWHVPTCLADTAATASATSAQCPSHTSADCSICSPSQPPAVSKLTMLNGASPPSSRPGGDAHGAAPSSGRSPRRSPPAASGRQAADDDARGVHAVEGDGVDGPPRHYRAHHLDLLPQAAAIAPSVSGSTALCSRRARDHAGGWCCDAACRGRWIPPPTELPGSRACWRRTDRSTRSR